MCFIVHVGGTRCVTWSIDRIIQRHACITWGVEFIPRNFFHLFLVCLTDMTNTIARFFQWLTLSGAMVPGSRKSTQDYFRLMNSLQLLITTVYKSQPPPGTEPLKRSHPPRTVPTAQLSILQNVVQTMTVLVRMNHHAKEYVKS
jgi:hypothetical protein